MSARLIKVCRGLFRSFNFGLTIISDVSKACSFVYVTSGTLYKSWPLILWCVSFCFCLSLEWFSIPQFVEFPSPFVHCSCVLFCLYAMTGPPSRSCYELFALNLELCMIFLVSF